MVRSQQFEDSVPLFKQFTKYPLQLIFIHESPAVFDSEIEYQKEKYGQYNVWPPTHNQYGGGSEEGRMLQEVGQKKSVADLETWFFSFLPWSLPGTEK